MSQEYAFLKNPLDEQIICWWWGLNLAPEDRVHYEICAFSQYLQHILSEHQFSRHFPTETCESPGIESHAADDGIGRAWRTRLSLGKAEVSHEVVKLVKNSWFGVGWDISYSLKYDLCQWLVILMTITLIRLITIRLSVGNFLTSSTTTPGPFKLGTWQWAAGGRRALNHSQKYKSSVVECQGMIYIYREKNFFSKARLKTLQSLRKVCTWWNFAGSPPTQGDWAAGPKRTPVWCVPEANPCETLLSRSTLHT